MNEQPVDDLMTNIRAMRELVKENIRGSAGEAIRTHLSETMALVIEYREAVRWQPDLRAIELLQAARDRIAQPEHWIQGTEAVTANRVDVPAIHFAAECFSLEGAIKRTSAERSYPHTNHLLMYVDRQLNEADPSIHEAAELNDFSDHAKVLEGVDQVIEKAVQNVLGNTKSGRFSAALPNFSNIPYTRRV